MDNEGFRGSLFGGFNRSDVAAFITGMSKELNVYKTECEGLRSDKQELLSKIDYLSSQVSALIKEKNELAEQAEALTNENQEIARLNAVIAGMQEKIDEDARAIETFDRMKARLSVMEYEACKRAQEIENAAADKYEHIMNRLGGIITSLRSEYDDIRSGTEVTAKQLRGEINSIEQRIGQVSSVLGKTADNFDILEKYVKDPNTEI